MTINVYQLGDLARCSAEFRDSAGVLTDPTGIAFKYTTPSGAETTHAYPAAPVVKESTGKYHVDLTCSERGQWRYAWASTGVAQAAEQFEFHVEPG